MYAVAGLSVSCLILASGLVGLVLGVLALYILARRQAAIPMASLLLGLTVADIGVVLMASFYMGVQGVCVYLERQQNVTDGGPCGVTLLTFLGDRILAGVWNWLLMAEGYLVLALALVRYMAVNRPMKAGKWNARGRHARLVLIIFAVSLVLVLPVFLQGRVIPVDFFIIPRNQTFESHPNHSSNSTIPPITYSFNWFKLYDVIVLFAVEFAVPLICSAYLNIKFIIGLRQFMKNRAAIAHKESGKNSKSQQSTSTRVVVLVLTWFFVCHGTALALDCYLFYPMTLLIPIDLYILYGMLSALCITLNSTGNFIIYFLLLPDLHRSLRELTCGYRAETSHSGTTEHATILQLSAM